MTPEPTGLTYHFFNNSLSYSHCHRSNCVSVSLNEENFVAQNAMSVVWQFDRSFYGGRDQNKVFSSSAHCVVARSPRSHLATRTPQLCWTIRRQAATLCVDQLSAGRKSLMRIYPDLSRELTLIIRDSR